MKNLDFFEIILIIILTIVTSLSIVRIIQEGKVEVFLLERWFSGMMAIAAIAGGYEGVKNFNKNRGGGTI